MGFGDFFKPKSKKDVSPVETAPVSDEARRAAIRAEAMATARAARERLGDDTIQKIAEALREQSAGKAARDKIRDLDKGRVADHLKSLLDDKDDR